MNPFNIDALIADKKREVARYRDLMVNAELELKNLQRVQYDPLESALVEIEHLKQYIAKLEDMGDTR